jgi:CubicO group peptidase (beta-lactamase class C family)
MGLWRQKGMKTNGWTDELERFIFQRMTASGIVGLSIATIRGGEVNYQRGFGFRDFQKGSSATPETIYCIGSVTKSFTALAVMQLCEAGKLSLDDPVEKWLDFKERPMGVKILVRHLLSHTSGLSALGYAEATLAAVTDKPDIWLPISNADDLLVFMRGAEEWALAKPGERHAYLNEGYIMLGAIIEKASGSSYPEYVEEKILTPLHMYRSSFKEDDVEGDEDLAVPYITNSEGGKVATRYPYGQMISDGGLMSSASDMGNYLRMMLGLGAFEDNRLASEESIREMASPKIRMLDEPVNGVDHRYYGYGLRLKDNFLGHRLVQHSGSVFGSSAYINFVPDAGVGVAILSNGGYFLEDMGEYAAALLLGKDPMEIPSFKRGRILESLTGTYKTFKDTSNYRIIRSGGVLQLEQSWGDRVFTTPMIPVDIEGPVKKFSTYGTDTVTQAEFVERDGETYLVYERNLCRRMGPQ